MKRWKLGLSLLALMTLSAACAGPGTNGNPGGAGAPGTQSNAGEEKTSSREPVKLEFASNAKESTLEVYQSIAARFTAENPHITVEVSGITKDFEALMNARMANHDLPDLWTTHGWSVRKYSEYLRPLNDQPWTGQLADEIKPIITNENGELFVLPFDVDLSGMIYNERLLRELGIEAPATWEQFLQACEAIKAAGYTPVHIGGKDTSDVAGMLGRIALSLLVEGHPEYGPQLRDGSFDWTAFGEVTDFVLQLQQKGYLNVDHLTADKSATFNAFAQNKAAFAFQSNQSIYEILKLNPEAEVSMMRVPVKAAGNEPFLISGERNAVGVWKDTKHEAEALQFLAYLSKPEHVSAIAETYSLPAALKDIEVKLGVLDGVFSRYGQARVFSHFDREYLPNGMWNTLKTVGPGLLSGSMSAAQVSDTMKEDYVRLRIEQP